MFMETKCLSVFAQVYFSISVVATMFTLQTEKGAGVNTCICLPATIRCQSQFLPPVFPLCRQSHNLNRQFWANKGQLAVFPLETGCTVTLLENVKTLGQYTC